MLFTGGSVTAGQDQSLEERLEAARVALDSASPQFQRMAEGKGYCNSMNSDMKPDWLRHNVWKEPSPPASSVPCDAAALETENARLVAENRRLTQEMAAMRAGAVLGGGPAV